MQNRLMQLCLIYAMLTPKKIQLVMAYRMDLCGSTGKNMTGISNKHCKTERQGFF